MRIVYFTVAVRGPYFQHTACKTLQIAHSPGADKERILVLLQQFEVVLVRLVTQKSLRLLLSCKTQEHTIYHTAQVA
jgi:hypothetical protein